MPLTKSYSYGFSVSSLVTRRREKEAIEGYIKTAYDSFGMFNAGEESMYFDWCARQELNLRPSDS